MSILSVILLIVLMGVLLWALNSFIPMDPKIRNILNLVVVVLLVVWLLQGFGVLGSFGWRSAESPASSGTRVAVALEANHRIQDLEGQPRTPPGRRPLDNGKSY